jgi:serine/threonine-protein kinase
LELAGKYRLICELGQGGMAVVYLAVALGAANFRKLAVVKVIRPQVAEEPGVREMFFDEARLSARLNHPNIVQTYDVGESSGKHFMAMEYLEGASLSAILAHLKPPFALRAKALLEVLEGLRYAHELKDFDGTPLHIVHRDISPQNVFLTYTGQVKVLDFGIAKAATSSVQTATGVIKGKLKYMAPEQGLGRAVDGRADLYAVGVMLWEAMTGRRRFAPGVTEVAVFAAVASGVMPETPGAKELGYPGELDDILKRALAPNPADRYQTAGEFHAELDAVIQKMPPCSLKDLGAVAAEAFAAQRSEVNAVLQKRLRLLGAAEGAETTDDGRPTSPEQVPTVRPPRGTTESSIHAGGALPALGPTQGGSPDDGGSKGAAPEGSTQHGLVARVRASLVPVPSTGARWAVAVGALGIALALALVAGVWRAHGSTDPRLGARGEPAPSVPASLAALTSAESAVAPAASQRPPSPVDVPAAAPSAAERSGARAAAAGPAVPTRSRKGPVTGPAPEGLAPPAAPASASPAASRAEVERAVAPRPSTPKVQLERDNPWN